MAGTRKAINAAALVALLLVAAVAAADAITLCGVNDIGSAVAACKPYCLKGSTMAAPGDACCGKVKSADWECLKKFKNKLSSDIDPARVVDLANKC